MKRFALIPTLLCCIIPASAQFGPGRDPALPFNLRTEAWNARWISVPGTAPDAYGVYCFRKDVELEGVPADYPVHVTGDNRYKLYVNGVLVSLGPAKGDATHWNYESVDLAPQLRPGRNAIAALVWHEGAQKPDSQVSVAAGFLLQGEGNARELHTDGSWKCFRDEAYSPLDVHVPGYYVAGPGEEVDMRRQIPGWNLASTPTDDWLDARPGPAGEPADYNGSDQGDGHNLRPSPIAPMEMTPIRLRSVRKADGIAADESFLQGTQSLTVPAGKTVELLLDQGELTNAYLHLNLSGGKGATLRIGYAESLYLPGKPIDPSALPADLPEAHRHFLMMPRTGGKGNRDEVEGKIFLGREDLLHADGREDRDWTSLSWRTWRYIRLQVETGDEALTLNDLSATFTGYPLTLNARLETDRQDLREIFETGWRTARLCAWETYMDCPYYEQLQYLGDTRIQALVTLYNSGDDTPVKNFLRLADMSRNADGITKSRYPTTLAQYIQPYALSYIYALHDYLMYGADPAFVYDLLPGAEQILGYFARYQQADGRLKDLPGWNFSDWVHVPSWNYGAPLKGADGCSILMDLQLLYACQLMADMEAQRGDGYHAARYRAEADRLGGAIRENYWSAERGLFSDRSERDNFSQHANAMAILCDIAPDPADIARKLLEDDSLAPCSVYYRFYLHQALVKAGLGDRYPDWLDIWRENLAMGMTTWGETSDVNGTRSDCHAWGSSPNIELFRTVLGIDSDAVAFRSVRIEPHLGEIRAISGSIPHPSGSVQVRYQRDDSGLEARIDLPEGVDGRFVWKGRSYPLHEKNNILKIK